MSQKVERIVQDALAGVIDLFVTAWVLMMMVGTLLGNAGLWTPAFWESFGAVYVISTVVGYASRVYYRVLKVLAEQDARHAARTKAPLI